MIRNSSVFEFILDFIIVSSGVDMIDSRVCVAITSSDHFTICTRLRLKASPKTICKFITRNIRMLRDDASNDELESIGHHCLDQLTSTKRYFCLQRHCSC